MGFFFLKILSIVGTLHTKATPLHRRNATPVSWYPCLWDDWTNSLTSLFTLHFATFGRLAITVLQYFWNMIVTSLLKLSFLKILVF
jgi:hypothetical protein